MLPPPTPPSRPGGLRRAAPAALAALGMLAALTLVVAASHGHPLAPFRRAALRPSPVFGALGLGIQYGLLVVANVALVLPLVLILRHRLPRGRGESPADPLPLLRWRTRLALAAVPVGLLALQVWLIALQLRRRRGPVSGGAPPPADLARRISQARLQGPGPLAPTLAGWLLTLLAAVLLVGLALAGSWWLRRRRAAAARPLSALLAESLDQGLGDLDDGGEPRRAVIATYARMERVLAAHGLPRDPAEAPHEYLGRVLAALRVSGPAASRLTGLFEQARFSRGTVDETMRVEAMGALGRLRDELEAA